MQRKVAFAIVAHPDDIEFLMAGTLLLLREKGFEIHTLNVSSGNCGSQTRKAAEVRRIRRLESIEAARVLGAHFHPGFADDLEIFYDARSLRRLAAVVREVCPTVILTHSPQDYMEDHMNTCRLAVTAAFARGMPNFVTNPRRSATQGDVTVYHAMPHGLRDERTFFCSSKCVRRIPSASKSRPSTACDGASRMPLTTSPVCSRRPSKANCGILLGGHSHHFLHCGEPHYHLTQTVF